MRMTPGEQQQEFILPLAEGGGIFCRLLHLPDAQAELKPLCGGLLRQASSKPELADVGTDRNGPVQKLISQKTLLSDWRITTDRQNKNTGARPNSLHYLNINLIVQCVMNCLRDN